MTTMNSVSEFKELRVLNWKKNSVITIIISRPHQRSS